MSLHSVKSFNRPLTLTSAAPWQRIPRATFSSR